VVDSGKLINELRLHQIELEMQNDELQRAKAEAQKIAKKYTLLYNFATSALLTINQQSEIIELNISAAQLLGKSRLSLINSRFGFFVSDDTKPVFNHFLSQIFISREKESYEVTLISSDKLQIFVLLTGIVSDDGENCLLTVRDISERKKAGIEKLELQKHAMEAQKIETVGILAGGIAYNFNYQLSSALSNLEYLNIIQIDNPEIRNRIANARESVEKVGNLAKQLMVYSGKGLYDFMEFDMNNFITSNVALFKNLIGKQTSLELNIHDKSSLIKGDENQLKFVLMNLLANASDAIGDKDGIIKVSTGIRYYDADSLSGCIVPIKPTVGNYFFIKISDNGCGMDEATIEKIFEPFFTTKQSGRGLGLSSVMGILVAHHGEVFVDSSIGQGTVITIILPALNVGSYCED